MKYFVGNKLKYLSYILNVKCLKRTGKRQFSWIYIYRVKIQIS